MMRGTWMVYFVVTTAALNSAAPVSPDSPSADLTSTVAMDRVPLNAGCGFTHPGDQSRSLNLAVSELHMEVGEPGKVMLAWTGPAFAKYLDGYEYRAYGTVDGSHAATWVDTRSREPGAEVVVLRSGNGYTFDVVARYRYPFRDGRNYYWYGPVATTEHTVSANAGCGPAFGPADAAPAYE